MNNKENRRPNAQSGRKVMGRKKGANDNAQKKSIKSKQNYQANRPFGKRPIKKVVKSSSNVFEDKILGSIDLGKTQKTTIVKNKSTHINKKHNLKTNKQQRQVRPGTNQRSQKQSQQRSQKQSQPRQQIKQSGGSRPQKIIRTKQQRPVNRKEDILKIIPIGGCEEVGRNMTVFEYKGDIVILDMGIQFPEEDMPGIDYIIPNTDYLKGREKDIKGVIFSHGHLDHIGAAPILLEKLGNPTIIGRNMTLAMIKHRVEDYKKGTSQKLKTVLIKKVTDKLKLGPFSISFFQIEHSIMDAVGVVLHTPHGTVIHPGDWTMERDNKGKPLVDYAHLSSLPSPKILMLESLGSTDIRPSASTETMKKNLTSIVSKSPSRVIIGTFSSQIERIGWIIEMAQKMGKKVVLEGYSMKMNVEIAQKLGYIKAAKGTLIKMEQASSFADNKLIVLCTGAQGESNAVLSRIVDGSHRTIKLRRDDTVVFSSSVIPGNERTIQRLKDNLYRQCDNVIHGNIMDIHVSGHGNRDDIIHILKSVKPDYYIPVYANHYMLREAGKLAEGINFRKDRIFVPDNGSIIEFDRRGGRLTNKKVPSDYVFVDGLGVTDSHNVILRDRKMMAEDGMLVIIATISRKTGELVHNPDMISRGFVYMKENKKLIEMTRQKAKKILKDHNPKTAPDEQMIRERIRNEIGKFLFQKTEKRPMILPVLIEV